ncbi:hypothetical protein [Anatilimnocola floriformis]|uniref:hypothetical protein n=1 Tax=Anatilimnocola floriformis TaxID=2948575 RepID=UPI0020C4DF03|nr:hypothetical protein [Anatilimnocola floriformis]
MTGADEHIKGFRYYLARPYVVVKKRIKVSQQVSLLAINTKDTSWAKAFVESYGRNPAEALALVPAQYVRRCETNNDAFEAVSASEWEAMKNRLRPAKSDVLPVSHTESLGAMNLASTLQAAAPAAAVAAPVQGQVAASAAKQTSETRPSAPLADAECQTPAGPSVALSGDIEVIFLPDMDEQYAVHNRNFLAKSSYNLQFKEGWQLAAVNGEFDSTEVAIEVLNTIDSAIEAAKSVATARLPLRYPTPPAPGGNADKTIPLADSKAGREIVFLEALAVTYLRPGIYRVNKPWEMENGKPDSPGLLAQMGLPTVTDYRVKPADSLPTQPELATE